MNIWTAHYNNRRGMLYSFGARDEHEARVMAGRLGILTGWMVVRLHNGPLRRALPADAGTGHGGG